MGAFGLAAEAELRDDLAVSLDVFALQVIQQPASPAHHLQEAPPRGMILLVGLEVLGQVRDPPGEDRDLDLGGAGVALGSWRAPR